jgi:tetratricopeptide (TPR) repeat protein
VIQVVGFASVRFWLGALSAGLSLALTWQLRRRERLGALALAWVGLSILVVSNLPFAIGIWVAERTLYLASVGVAIGAAALVGTVGAHAPSALRGTFAAATLAVALGAWRTVDRIPAWHDTEAVFRTLAEEHPESFRGQWWLARRLTDGGDYDAGLRWFERATVTSPNDLRLKLDYARALLLAGRPAVAEALVDPLPGTDPARFVYLAQSRIMTGRLDEAREDVQEGLARFPNDARLIGQARELGIEP